MFATLRIAVFTENLVGFKVSARLAYIISQGEITATIVWFVIITGATAKLSYYKEKREHLSLYLSSLAT